MNNIEKALQDNSIVFFDGVCNYCNGFVRFLIRNDPEEKLKFSSIQSAFAELVFKQENIKDELSTIIFIDQKRVFYRSNAVVEMMKKSNSKLRILAFMIKIVPLSIREYIYELIAKNRYSIFGKSEECVIPSKEINHLSL